MLKFFNNKKISYLALALIIGAIIVLLLVSSCNPSYIYTHPGDTIQAGLDSVEKVLPSKPAPRQFLDLEALKEHAIAKIRRQQREILESYNLSKPYLPKNYKLVIYDLTLLPLKLVDFFFSKQGAVLARDPYHFVIFSPEKVDFSPEAKAFRWVAREGRKLINSDKGLVLSESLGTKIKYYEYTNMTHFTYNSFLYHFCGMYPVSLSRESVTLNGWRYAAHCYRMSNFMSYDNLWAFVETYMYAWFNFETCLHVISSFYTYSIFFFFFFFMFTTLIVTVAQPLLGLRGTVKAAITSLIILFIGCALVFLHLTKTGRVYFLDFKIYAIYLPSITNSITISVDYLSSAFMFLVVAIGLAATVYSRVYLYGDPQTPDFIVKLLWFVFSMLLLVISKNIITLYLSWEFIGITSMWLINFNSQRTDTFKSAIKAFTFNKVSDLCLFSGLLVGYLIFKNTNIQSWLINIEALNLYTSSVLISSKWLGPLILIAASIKSAQLGFHLWLPDSMDAPVPASALIHSATLVSAGVYLILRFFDILQVSGFLPLISVLGALTAAYGGIVAGLQTDLKRALAYSTISHCGFLFTFTALGGSSASLLYLFLHGFFKALSFICAGEFIRVSAGYQDLNRMGGGFFQTPSLSAQFLVAMGNLCGLPFFIGYFFKSNFQNYVLNSGYVNFLLVVLLLVGLLCSLLYFFKVFYCVVFSFKKTNFKLLQESLKQNKNYFKYPLKNPRALVAIFWFLMIATLVCIFLYFPFKNNIITCNITDTQVSSMGLLSVPTNNSVVKHNQVNYLFAFYTFFLCIAVTLIISYSCRRIGWCSFINNLFLVIAALILGYAYLLIS